MCVETSHSKEDCKKTVCSLDDCYSENLIGVGIKTCPVCESSTKEVERVVETETYFDYKEICGKTSLRQMFLPQDIYPDSDYTERRFFYGDIDCFSNYKSSFEIITQPINPEKSVSKFENYYFKEIELLKPYCYEIKVSYCFASERV